MIQAFLESVLPDLEGEATIWWRRKQGAGTPVDASAWFKYPAELDKMIAQVEKLSAGDVYFSPTLYSSHKRLPENATFTQTIWCDADTADPSEFRLPPSVVVQSSTGRWQLYWNLVEPIPTEEASRLAKIICYAHQDKGADLSSWPANKLMRVPFTHNTGHGFPEQVKVHYTGHVYSDMDILGAYENVTVPERPQNMPSAAPEGTVETPEGLPDYGQSLEKVSARTMELALAEPRADQDRSRLRYKLLLELSRDGLTFDEVLSVAWHAPAARKWSTEDARGFQGLLAEATKAFAEAQIDAPAVIEPPEADEVGVTVTGDVSLLTDPERQSIRGLKPFVKRYAEHAATRTENPNTPYQRMNGWTILSAALAQTGFIPRRNGKENLCIYTMTLGETTTGKSWERKLMFTFLKEVFANDPDYNIGGNPSPSALGKKLLERDGKVSFFNKDEAHGALKAWTTQDWTTGLLEDLAELYDGRVPPQLRTGNWEGSGKSAETFFIMHLMGTPKAMIATLNRDLFLSGFLARFQWCIGTPREVTYDSMAEEDSTGDDIRLGFDPMSRQIAAELCLMKRHARLDIEGGGDKVPVRIEKAAAKRLQDTKWELTKRYQKDRNFEILEPSLVRMGVTIRKSASLIALSEGRTVATMTDVLLAIESAEEWVSNLATIASQISASDFERACDEIEEFIKDKGGSVKREVVMRRFKSLELRFLIGYVEALVQQGRIREISGEHKERYLETPNKGEKK